ncbi:MAG: hypothetical protein M9899_09705 [Bdellovibrionaceae bacterium]|nr:hypothetical protein [Pseudobdellovibrionaceae bacterium]
MKYIFSLLFLVGMSAVATNAHANCSSTLDSKTDANLKRFIEKLDPFWGTWRGTYQGERIVGELYLDKQNRFNITGSYKNQNIRDVKVKLCYRNNKFQAVVYGFTADVEVLSSRSLRANHFLLSEPVTVKR